MPRMSKTDKELAYLRSAWEELEEQAVEYGFMTDLLMTPTISRGVWSLSAIAVSKELDGQGHPVATERVTFRYPNGRNVMFAGELWSVMHRFTEQIAEARDRIERTRK